MPPPRGHIYSWFLAKTHQKRVFCSTIREERRPIRAHLPFSLSPQEALFIRDFWLKRSKDVFLAPKYAKKEGQSGLPYHFPCPRQEAIFIRGFWQKRIKNVFFCHNARRKKANRGSSAIVRAPPPRGRIYSCFLATRHCKRVLCSAPKGVSGSGRSP